MSHSDWLAKLSVLNPAKGRNPDQGVAPHKPLLLLCILDLADAGELPSRLPRSASLVLRFRSYGSLVSDRWPTRLDLRLPFFHLKTQGFWRALDKDQNPAQSPESCVAIDLDPQFHEAIRNPAFRLDGRLLLAKAYFPAVEQAALLEAMGLRDSRNLGEHSQGLMIAAAEGAKRKGRSARFQVGVVDGYHHTCALTGYRCLTDEGATVVDAAHIESWAETQNDDLGNGLALSKTAHWMFDVGLWTVDDDLRIVVNTSRFTEAGPDGHLLRAAAGRHLQFAPRAQLRPSIQCLRRHRQKWP